MDRVFDTIIDLLPIILVLGVGGSISLYALYLTNSERKDRHVGSPDEQYQRLEKVYAEAVQDRINLLAKVAELERENEALRRQISERI